MRTLELATPPKNLDDVLEAETALLGALLEGFEVLGIFGKAHSNSLAHELRDGAIGRGGLEA